MRYLYEEDGIIYAACENCGRVLKFKKYELDDIKTGVECFCGNISDKIDGLPKPQKASTTSVPSYTPQRSINTTVNPSVASTHKPKCPTCGSTNITKISLTSKAVGGVMFGVLSSNIRNSFKCNNCGYKW